MLTSVKGTCIVATLYVFSTCCRYNNRWNVYLIIIILCYSHLLINTLKLHIHECYFIFWVSLLNLTCVYTGYFNRTDFAPNYSRWRTFSFSWQDENILCYVMLMIKLQSRNMYTYPNDLNTNCYSKMWFIHCTTSSSYSVLSLPTILM